MGGSGVESAFQFISYKIDTFKLEVTKDTRSLVFIGIVGPGQVQMSLTIRNPLRISVDNSYIGGADVQFSLFHSTEQKPETTLATGSVGISGLFKVLAGQLAAETENNLVRLQIPAILMPYLRAALSSLLINAGFLGVMLPLINVHAIVAQIGDKLKIEEATVPQASGGPKVAEAP